MRWVTSAATASPRRGAVQAWPASEATTSDPMAKAAAGSGVRRHSGRASAAAAASTPSTMRMIDSCPGRVSHARSGTSPNPSRKLRPALSASVATSEIPTPTTPARAVTPAKVPSRARAASSPRRRPVPPAGRRSRRHPSRAHRSAAPAAESVPAKPSQRPKPPMTSSAVSEPSSRATAPVSRPTWYTNEPSSVWLSSLVTRQATV